MRRQELAAGMAKSNFSRWDSASPFLLCFARKHGEAMGMQDCFAIFEEPRLPLLDEEALKARFHALTALHHPDVASEKSEAFSNINLAYEVLRNPRARLKHLLELEAPNLLARHLPAPDSIAALFPGMGECKQALDGFLRKRAAATSALTRAMLTGEQLTLQESLGDWLGVLEKERTAWLEKLPMLDAAWRENPAEAAPGVAEVAQALGYLDKWAAQIREGIVRLQIDGF